MSEFNLIQEVVGKKSNVVFFVVSGSIDAHTFFDFENSVMSVIDNGVNYILIDVSNVNFISSAGLGAFMSIYDKLNSKSPPGKLAVINCSAQFSEVFTMMGFDELFSSFSSLEEGLNDWKM